MKLGWMRRPDVIMVAASAPTYVATSAALEQIDPFDLAPLRYLGTAVVVGLYLLVRRRRLRWPGRDLGRMIAVGILGYGGYGLLVNVGQTAVSAGTASLVLNLSPVFAALLGFLILKDRIGARGVAGIAVAVGGVALVAAAADDLRFDPHVVYIMAASLSLAVFLIVQQPLLARIPAADVVFWGSLCGGLSTLPFARWHTAPATWSAQTWIALVALVVVTGAIAYTYWNITLAETSVSQGGALLFTIPVFSVLFGWLLLGQPASLATLVGGAISLVGVILLSHTARNTTPPAATSRSRPSP